MAADDVDVNFDHIRSSAGDVDEVVQKLGRELKAAQAELESFGDAFGGDDLGMLMGGTHEVVSQYAFDQLSNLLEGLVSHSKALDHVASTYRGNEDAGAQLLGDVGNDVEAV